MSRRRQAEKEAINLRSPCPRYKKFKGPSNSIDQQLFRGEVALDFVFPAVIFAAYFCLWVLCLLSRMLGSSCDLPISLVIPVLRIFKG